MDLPMNSALDDAAMREARRRWDGVAKPLRSLGALEDLLTQIAGIQGTAEIALAPRCALVFCADHGVVAEGVAQSSSEVTAKVAASIAEGTANVNLMTDAAVFAVDVGMLTEVPGVPVRKAARGTGNIAREPAMTREQAAQTLQAGIDMVGEKRAQGYRVMATGEMGIGNTTAATAIACALLGLSPEKVTGRGAGLSDDGLRRKTEAVRRALAFNRPDRNDPLDALCKVGGYEIAAMAGAFLGGARYRVPVVIDGMISAVAALTAARLCPAAGNFMLPSHMSREPVTACVMDELGLAPMLRADLALGEGTGAALLFPLLDAADRVYRGAHTFRRLGMAAYTPQEGTP